MAIIYSYPEIPDVQGGDLLLISDTGAPNKPTRSVDIDDLAAYIGTVVGVVQNLQSVLTVGNTYVSPDGYGTFTLNDITNNDGQIKYLNTDEGWGYFLNAEEGLFFTDGTGSQTGSTSIGLGYVSIGNSNHIGEIRSANITANRTYQLPNASGTLALTSELANVVYSNQDADITAEWTFYEDLLLDGANLGIGTTSPDSLLEIYTTDTTKDFIKLTSGAGSVNPTLIFEKSATEQGVIQYIRNGDLKLYNTDSDGGVMISGSGASNYDMYINNSGNVGIGTTSPSEKLEVNGNIRVADEGEIYIQGGTSTRKIVRLKNTNDKGLITLDRSDETKVYISSDFNTHGHTYFNGLNVNVGIGTTSPSEKLEVSGKAIIRKSGSATAHSDTDLLVTDATAASSTAAIEILGGNAGYSNIKFADTDSYTSGSIDYNHSSNSMTFRTNNSQNVIINSSGNVGIGTTSPQHILDVADSGINSTAPTIRLTNTANYNASAWGGNTSHSIEFYSTDPSGNRVASAIENIAGIDKGGLLTGNLVFKTNDYPTPGTLTEKMRIAEDGNVGIGTTSPSEKLEVAGNILVSGSNDSADGLHLKDRTFIAFSDAGSVVSRFRSSAAGVFQFQDGSYNTNVVLNNNGNSYLNGGNLGIGTTSPAYILDVVSAGTATARLKSAGTGAISLRYENGSGFKSAAVVDNNGLYRLDATNISLNPTNNVGIGTTAPSTKLHVNGDIRIQGENELYFGGTGSVPNWEITASGSDLIVNDTGTNVGSVLFNNDEGVALPRLTTTEINAISLPAQGLMAYNTTLNTICFYNGSSWQKVSHANM